METEEKNKSEEPLAGNVRVLSPEERLFYDGVTIEGGADADAKTYNTRDYRENFNIKSYNFSNTSILSKIILTLALTGIALFLLFIALPIALVVLGVILTIWIVLSFFQKK